MNGNDQEHNELRNCDDRGEVSIFDVTGMGLPSDSVMPRNDE